MVGKSVVYHHPSGEDKPAVVYAEPEGTKKVTLLILDFPQNYIVEHVTKGKQSGKYEDAK